MIEDIDYGGWLIEDLRDHYKELIKDRDRCEVYSDRAQLNKQALIIMREMQERNEE